MVFKMCEGISCSSFSVKELDVIVCKKYFLCITLLNFGQSVPHLTSEPGGWGGNHQILLDPQEQISMKFYRKSYIFIQENSFENVIWKMASILSRPQCVNSRY